MVHNTSIYREERLQALLVRTIYYVTHFHTGENNFIDGLKISLFWKLYIQDVSPEINYLLWFLLKSSPLLIFYTDERFVNTYTYYIIFHIAYIILFHIIYEIILGAECMLSVFDRNSFILNQPYKYRKINKRYKCIIKYSSKYRLMYHSASFFVCIMIYHWIQI